jgi:hypothetical protein
MRLLETLILKVEIFAGEDINSATSDLCELATRIGVRCEADFNGVKLIARPKDSWPRLVDAYYRQLQQKEHHKIAQADPEPVALFIDDADQIGRTAKP